MRAIRFTIEIPLVDIFPWMNGKSDVAVIRAVTHHIRNEWLGSCIKMLDSGRTDYDWGVQVVEK